ncbi:hypothetical protein HELRODRAFT_166896 [Helobdella robusta]|uniref:Fibronectin type-III domain-containing protein n=1 Tax=Helobdella robusta TaxID=6412 RepID=T1EYQ3_HELRO|nr:hypothetical protein HELRODRAFT_166896 [Helobdella robusta]ESO11836.1 hypothetical protein HELRODRAFT_166896 [Helobdella robusta]
MAYPYINKKINLSTSASLKPLGVTLDPSLTFKAHTFALIKTCNYIIWLIYPIRPFFMGLEIRMIWVLFRHHHVISVPRAPQNVRIFNITSSCMTLTWDIPITDEDGKTDEATQYYIEMKEDRQPNFCPIARVNGKVNFFALEFLYQDKKYMFRVRGKNSAGYGEAAEIDHFVQLNKTLGQRDGIAVKIAWCCFISTTWAAIQQSLVPVQSPGKEANNYNGSVVARDNKDRIAASGTRSYNEKFVTESQRGKMKMKFTVGIRNVRSLWQGWNIYDAEKRA